MSRRNRSPPEPLPLLKSAILTFSGRFPSVALGTVLLHADRWRHKPTGEKTSREKRREKWKRGRKEEAKEAKEATPPTLLPSKKREEAERPGKEMACSKRGFMIETFKLHFFCSLYLNRKLSISKFVLDLSDTKLIDTLCQFSLVNLNTFLLIFVCFLCGLAGSTVKKKRKVEFLFSSLLSLPSSSS